MKQIFYILFTFCAFNMSFAQDIEIYDGDELVDVSGTVIDVDGWDDMEYHVSVKYTGRTSKNLQIERVKVDELEGTRDYICWGITCYYDDLVAPLNPFVTPDAILMTENQSTLLFSYHLTFGVAGCARYRYYIIDETDTRLDSIDIRYCTYLKVDDTPEVTMNVFPNPANNELTVNINNAASNQTTFKLFNVIGEEVLEQTIVNGQNKVDVSKYSNGIYFYSVLNNNDIIETKKLVIKH